MNKILGVTNTENYEKVEGFKSWAKMVDWMEEQINCGIAIDLLLPYCNDWNLDYWQAGETKEEYKGRLIEMAIGLQLI